MAGRSGCHGHRRSTFTIFRTRSRRSSATAAISARASATRGSSRDSRERRRAAAGAATSRRGHVPHRQRRHADRPATRAARRGASRVRRAGDAGARAESGAGHVMAAWCSTRDGMSSGSCRGAAAVGSITSSACRWRSADRSSDGQLCERGLPAASQHRIGGRSDASSLDRRTTALASIAQAIRHAIAAVHVAHRTHVIGRVTRACTLRADDGVADASQPGGRARHTMTASRWRTGIDAVHLPERIDGLIGEARPRRASCRSPGRVRPAYFRVLLADGRIDRAGAYTLAAIDFATLPFANVARLLPSRCRCRFRPSSATPTPSASSRCRISAT